MPDMPTEALAPRKLAAPQRSIARLENGDRLTRAEFERRYEAMPELKKAELIEGVVYVPSPLSFDRHGRQDHYAGTWLGHYTAYTPGTEGAPNATVQLDLDNEPQPDEFLRISPRHGGQSRTSDKGYIVGAPELALEIAYSSVSYDLHDKLRAYRRNGVQEYIVWRVDDEEIDWFVLEEGQYVKLTPGENGVYKSRVFPGLWLDAPAILRGDMKAVLALLDEGLKSPEHAGFVDRLQSQAR